MFHLAGIDYTEDLVTYNAADHKVEQVRLFLSLVFTTMSMEQKFCFHKVCMKLKVEDFESVTCSNFEMQA